MRHGIRLTATLLVLLFAAIEVNAQDWSPDGAWLVVSSDVEGVPQVFAVRSDGSEVCQLTSGSLESRGPAWRSDGKSIVFYQGRGWAPALPRAQQWFDIVALDWPRGGEPRKLTEGRGYDSNPAWAPGNGRIAFGSNRHDRSDNFDIYVLDGPGKDPRRLTSHAASDFSPNWSPDGARIVFVSQRDGIDQLYLLDVKTGRQNRLTTGLGFDVFPDWSPDGRRIVFSSRRDGDVKSFNDMDLYVLDVESSAVSRVTATAGFDGDPRWSPDGEWIAFWSERQSQPGLYVIRPDESDLRLIAGTDRFQVSGSGKGAGLRCPHPES